MKTLRALLVTTAGVREVELDNTSEMSHLESMYKHIGCDLVDGAGYPDERHAAWVDDEGMMTATAGTLVSEVPWHAQLLYGNLLITGFDHRDGSTQAATMTVEKLTDMITCCYVLTSDEGAANDD